MKRKRTVLSFSVVMLLGLGAALAWAQQRPVPVVISFGGPVPDEEVASVLRKYSARPYELYMYAGGVAGKFGDRPSENPEEFIATARQDTVASTRGALDSVQKELRSLLQRASSTSALETSPELAEEGRARLRRFEQEKAILLASEGMLPLVYGVRALTSPDTVKALLSDPAVRHAAAGKWGRRGPDVERPTLEVNVNHYTNIESLPPAALFAEIERAAWVNREELRREF